MSIDVNYYSFSPSRADKHWLNFVEDFTVLRQKHAPWKQHEAESDNYRKKQKEAEANFEPQISAIRKKIFDHFDTQGYVIPRIEWNSDIGVDESGSPVFTMTDKDKMEYLLVYGCVYPRGVDLTRKDNPYLMLRTDAPELEEKYRKIISKRQDTLAKAANIAIISPSQDAGIVLTEHQKKLYDEASLGYLIYENIYDNTGLTRDLKAMDIFYGSFANEYFENPKIESSFLESLIEYFKLENDQGIPKKKEWIRAFQNINPMAVQEMGKIISKEYHWETDEADSAVTDYLQSVRPVVKDLKETPDAIFVRVYGGYPEAEPTSAEATLIERARKHASEFKGSLPPVL